MDAYTKQKSDAKYATKQEYNIQSNNLLLIKQEVSNVENGNHIFPYLQVAGQLAVGDVQQKGGTILLNGEALATTADVGGQLPQLQQLNKVQTRQHNQHNKQTLQQLM